MSTRRAAARPLRPALAALVAAGSLTLSGCAVLSPVQTDVKYPAADGFELSLVDVEFRDLAVVAGEKDGPGVLIGQAVNQGGTAVDVEFATATGTPVRASVPAYSSTTLSGATTQVTLDKIPDAPGGMTTVTIRTRASGQNIIEVPVLAPIGPYAEFAGS